MKYTAAQRKQSKSYRNKIYYYKTIAKKTSLQLEQKKQELISVIRDRNVASGLAVTLSDVRQFLTDEEAHTLFYAGLFADDEAYYEQDFRDVLIAYNFTNIAGNLCNRVGLQSIDDYKNQLMLEVEQDEGYQALYDKFEDAAQKHMDYTSEYEGWRNDVRNK